MSEIFNVYCGICHAICPIYHAAGDEPLRQQGRLDFNASLVLREEDNEVVYLGPEDSEKL